MTTTRRFFFILHLTIALWVVQGSMIANAQSSGRYFPFTGHYSKTPFLDYFDAHGGLDIFGNPLTEPVRNPNGVLTQYFQRAVMEYDAGNSSATRIQLLPLGILLHYTDAPVNTVDIPNPHDRLRRYFPQTGHAVSFAFLNFFDKVEGLTVLGFPISELKMEQARLVQYFQRGRLEWHPENPSRYKVQIGLLGVDYAHQVVTEQQNFSRLAPPVLPLATIAAHPTLTQPNSLYTCNATAKSRVMNNGGLQTITVHAIDKSTAHGSANIGVSLTVRFPTASRVFTANTDQNGEASMTFDIGSQPMGVIIAAEVTFAVKSAPVCDPARVYFLVWS